MLHLSPDRFDILAQTSAAPVRAGSVYKNLKVLQEMPNDQFLPSMRLFTGALGVTCEFCHQADRASDLNATKRISRQMITMTSNLNHESFGETPSVTCFTCHRGSRVPAIDQTLPVIMMEPVPQELPGAGNVLRRYINAIGGEAALRSMRSLRMIGHENFPTGEGGLEAKDVRVEIDEKAPNLRVVHYTSSTFSSAEGFDGRQGWSLSPKGICSPLSAPYQERAARAANFYESADFTKEYAQVLTTGTETVDGHRTYVVLAFPFHESPETLYFDATSGLLIRRISILRTEFGSLPFSTTYSDYRTIFHGVKLPFKMHMTPATPRSALISQSELTIEQIDTNAALNNNLFSCRKLVAGTVASH
jgi:hypothetical protein